MPGHISSYWARAGRPSKGQLCPLFSAIFTTCQKGKPPMERGTACLRMGPQRLSGGAGGEDPGGCPPPRGHCVFTCEHWEGEEMGHVAPLGVTESGGIFSDGHVLKRDCSRGCTVY